MGLDGGGKGLRLGHRKKGPSVRGAVRLLASLLFSETGWVDARWHIMMKTHHTGDWQERKIGGVAVSPLPSAVAEFARTKEALLWHLILNKCRVDTGEP
jgi:hypothetical protein